jgi:hypothetical protein
MENNKRDNGGSSDMDEGKQLSQYEMSVMMKKRLKEFLADTDKMPKALIFLMRNMRSVIFLYVFCGRIYSMISLIKIQHGSR